MLQKKGGVSWAHIPSFMFANNVFLMGLNNLVDRVDNEKKLQSANLEKMLLETKLHHQKELSSAEKQISTCQRRLHEKDLQLMETEAEAEIMLQDRLHEAEVELLTSQLDMEDQMHKLKEEIHTLKTALLFKENHNQSLQAQMQQLMYKVLVQFGPVALPTELPCLQKLG